MQLVKPVIEENESRIETNKKFIESNRILISSLEKEIQELEESNITLQGSIHFTYKSAISELEVEPLWYRWFPDDQVPSFPEEDVVEVDGATQSRYIPWWKVIPSWITWNTKAKRFQNFVRYFARGFDESVFVQARNRYWVKEEVLACIARADSDMGNANKSSNNIMNYWNNDRWQTRWYDNVLWSVMAAAHWMTEWKYLSKNTRIGHLSQWWRAYIWVEWCAEKWQYCYATSPINWRRNVNNCLTFIEWERKNWDTMTFKKKK